MLCLVEFLPWGGAGLPTESSVPVLQQVISRNFIGN
jgi:hypothetical protein